MPLRSTISYATSTALAALVLCVGVRASHADNVLRVHKRYDATAAPDGAPTRVAQAAVAGSDRAPASEPASPSPASLGVRHVNFPLPTWAAPQWTPDGYLVLAQPGLTSLWIEAYPGGDLRPLAEIAGSGEHATFPPNGRRVVWRANIGASPVTHVVQSRLTGDDQYDIRQLGPQSARIGYPVCLDNERVGCMIEGAWTVYDALGHVQSRVEGIDAEWVQPSPDGDALLYCIDGRPVLRSTHDGRATPLDVPSGTYARPRFSPDGAWMLVERADGGAVVVRRATGKATVLPPSGACQFSADSRSIVQVHTVIDAGTPSKPSELWAYVLETRQSSLLPTPISGAIAEIALSGDGRICAVTTTGDAYVWRIDLVP